MLPIPYSCQDISDEDVQEVVSVLRSGWITQGPAVPRFESGLAEYCSAKHCIAVSSGTAALHVCYQAMGLGPGDRLWTSPITFAATGNAALYLGASVDFVDVDPLTALMDSDALEAKLIEAETAGTLPKIVAPVHFTGRVAAMARIKQLSDKYGFRIVEDAAHALGAVHENGAAVGSCAYSDAAVLSFHPVKSITTAEGGAIVVNDHSLARRIDLLRSHGITKDSSLFEFEAPGPWYYEQQLLGYNYRLSDLHAALGSSQLTRLAEFIDKRRAIASRYAQALSSLPLQLPPSDSKGAWHLYVVGVGSRSRHTRQEVFEQMRTKQIGVNVHYIPLHTLPYYQALGFKQGQFPNAEAYYGQAMSIPIFPRLTDAQFDYVVEALKEVLA